MSQRARARLDRIAEQLAMLTRGEPAKTVASELRALQIQVIEHRGPEPMLAVAKFERPAGLHFTTIDAKEMGEVVVITEREDDAPEIIHARNTKLDDLRRRGFGDVPVVIVRQSVSERSLTVDRLPPPHATSSAFDAASLSRDPYQSEESQ